MFGHEQMQQHGDVASSLGDEAIGEDLQDLGAATPRLAAGELDIIRNSLGAETDHRDF